MATCWDVLAAMAHVRDCTGDPACGLTAEEVVQVSLFMSPEEADAILATLRHRFPTLFDAAGAPLTPGTVPPHQDGQAVQAMQAAEAALSGVHTSVADFDRQLIAAILHAHKTTAAGRQSLDRLEKDIEQAVRSRPLDTALGARELQAYLISKLRDIIAVVGDANDSAESQRELVAALTALYAALGAPAEVGPPAPAPTPGPTTGPDEAPGLDPYLDAVPLDETGMVPEPDAAPRPTASAQPAPMMPTMPAFGGGGLPMTGSAPGELPLAGLLRGLAGEREPLQDVPAEGEPAMNDEADDEDEPPQTEADTTTVALPDGATVAAPSPQLARVIQAAVDGTPIPEAFGRQGITIPAPGSAVSAPIDPENVVAGDLGMFTDRYALVIGDGKALLDGQIQHITNVNGPSFLGWQHPPITATGGM